MENNIKKYRKKVGVSCDDLATLIGWKQNRISRYELGTRKPGLGECRLIVWALNTVGAGVTVDDVFPVEGR